MQTWWRWLHELKVDGYRSLAAIGQGAVRLYTRSGLDWTTQFGATVPAFEALSCASALIDGEVVAAGVDINGFSELQTRLKHGGALGFVAFDLLHPLADVPPEGRNACWVTPVLVAEVKFAELTGDGHIRHGTYQALRRD